MKKILFLLTIFTITSCGSIRKVDKSTTKVEKEVTVDQTKETTEVSKKIENKTTDTKTENQNDIVFEDLDIVPIDTTKTLDVTTPDGKVTKYKNAKFISKKTIDKSKSTKTENAVENKIIEVAIKSKEKAKIIAKEKAKVSVKHTESYKWNWWWLIWIFLAIITLRIIYVKYKRKLGW